MSFVRCALIEKNYAPRIGFHIFIASPALHFGGYLSEVLGRFVRDSADALPVIEHLEKTAIEIVPFTLKHSVCPANYHP